MNVLALVDSVSILLEVARQSCLSPLLDLIETRTGTDTKGSGHVHPHAHTHTYISGMMGQI